MQPKQTGYFVFIAAIGVMAGLLGNEVAQFSSWSEGFTPRFVGTALIHLGTVVGAFVGGRLIPTRIE